ncbi:MAG TPA: hypothetical protein PKV41_01460, partial [Candidatus Omnitrophota bacterium]|nr:hypothetical protein [Candidatus Omnitrophota bacterium]
MKRILGCFLLLTVMGCASITIPSYIRDTNPYRRIFYASFDRTREETRQVLSRAGWAIEKETEPELF